MEFEWDEGKRQSNLLKHGLDFNAVVELFDRPLLVSTSSHRTERRFVATGLIETQFVTVIYTKRDDRYRIISLRKVRNVERRAYNELYSRAATGNA